MIQLKPYQNQVLEDLKAFLDSLHRVSVSKAYFEQTQMNYIQNQLINKNSPMVCFKVPTGGGKTILGCHAMVDLVKNLKSEHRLVVWLVPSDAIFQQTFKQLNNPKHDYRQVLDQAFDHQVKILKLEQSLYGVDFNADSLRDQVTVCVMTYQSLRVKDKNGRKAYQSNEHLSPLKSELQTDDDSLISILSALNPIVIIDESHNAKSPLSNEMLAVLNPKFILELTATPRKDANILSSVSGFDLRKENMIKLPLFAYNCPNKSDPIGLAVELQKTLEALAKQEEKLTKKYIRPIVLFQAEINKESNDEQERLTIQEIKNQLIEIYQIPEDQIKIKASGIDELKNVDLMSKRCPVRFIITINALKEGWDCPFAYVLATIGNRSSQTDVTQLVGRILRQPYVIEHKNKALNASYLYTASNKFYKVLDDVVKSLMNLGYSQVDFYDEISAETLVKDDLQDSFKLESYDYQQEKESAKNQPDSTSETIEEEQESSPLTSSAIEKAVKQTLDNVNQTLDNKQNHSTEHKSKATNPILKKKDNPMIKINSQFSELIQKMKIPQFYQPQKDDLFSSFDDAPKYELVSAKSLAPKIKDPHLLKFNLTFNQHHSDLYKIDFDQTKEIKYEEIFDPIFERFIAGGEFDKLEKHLLKIFITKIESKKLFKNLPQEVFKIPFERLMKSLSLTELTQLTKHRHYYLDDLQSQIRHQFHHELHKVFTYETKINQIIAKNSYEFKAERELNEKILGIPKSLYQYESGNLNSYEHEFIQQLSKLDNILFWTRNNVYSDFYLNGSIKHYPDFLVCTKNHNLIAIETKGDHLDGSDSQLKMELGETWEKLSGNQYKYMMIFEHDKNLKQAHSKHEAIDLIKYL